eukprot:TRINITY_DN5203_c0_g1_i1.p1 TRINITY_DN5203_c0_g1~~TRINITY_DN5203_c0_g1_i1.p1  ORF type:complete len:221 (-),score=73.91 TRINITY_DN5203_c0_g1_i1:213-875(-)
MAPIVIYGMQLSAPCRILEMTCEMLGIEYDFQLLDLMKGEHMTPQYLAKNPQHNIPYMEDGNFGMNESRAAAAYLVNKYGKDDSLYPKDAEGRARVDQKMYFDSGVYYKAFMDVYYHNAMPNDFPKPGEKQLNRLKEVMGWMEKCVDGGRFAAGTDKISLADICLLASYTSFKEAGEDMSAYKNTQAWAARCMALIPNYQKCNGEGAAVFGAWMKPKSNL